MPVAYSVGSRVALVAIKLGHTLMWAFFVGCILAIPVMSLLGHHIAAAWLIALVAIEVAVLAINNWHCPLTPMAARFTADRAPNFDIYLPKALAADSKFIFGALYAAAIILALVLWRRTLG